MNFQVKCQLLCFKLNTIFANLLISFSKYYMTKVIKPDLVLNSDGSIYHLNLFPGDVSETIILVGDPGRVELVGSFFDTIELHKQNREIHTITGRYKDKRLSVISTGMGPDNIEIVINELDALFNIDFINEIERPEKTVLNLIRIGTSGALRKDIPVVKSFLVSEFGLGLDGLAYFYDMGKSVIDSKLTSSFIEHFNWNSDLPTPYGVKSSDMLLSKIGYGWRKGITLTAPGFYAPQGRELRLKVADNTILENSGTFTYGGNDITNFEMETSSLYVLSAMLGHHALTVCDIIANRINNDFNPDYKESMKELIGEVVERLTHI
jgi:uridine phosphorylase